MTNTIPTAAQIDSAWRRNHDRRQARMARQREAEAKLYEWAEACDAAARVVKRELLDMPVTEALPEDYARVAEVSAAVVQAWAAVHAAARPNGARD